MRERISSVSLTKYTFLLITSLFTWRDLSKCLWSKHSASRAQHGMQMWTGLLREETRLNCLRLGATVQFSCSIMSDSLQPHGLQHTRLPCSSPTPGAYSNSCLLSRWCHPTISPSVIPLSSRLQSFPASRSFPMSQFFTSGGQSIGVSASGSVLPMTIQDFRIWLVWSLCSPRDSQVSSLTPQFKNINSSVLRLLYSPALTSIHDYWKNHNTSAYEESVVSC